MVCDGKPLRTDEPLIMGVLNVTPDSFFAGSRAQREKTVLERARTILEEGGHFIDIGGYSSRPGAQDIPVEEERERVLPAIRAVKKEFPEARISIDTFRGEVARAALGEGACMINDISAGTFDPSIMAVAGEQKVPYVMMHMQGTPANMQQDPSYEDLIGELVRFFAERKAVLYDKGVNDVIVDPGFGFGKTVRHNYSLMHHLEAFHVLDLPLMVGVSRKSMINKVLGTTPDEALNGTTVLHAVALLNGASILRVHDVKEAAEAVKIISFVRDPEQPLN